MKSAAKKAIQKDPPYSLSEHLPDGQAVIRMTNNDGGKGIYDELLAYAHFEAGKFGLIKMCGSEDSKHGDIPQRLEFRIFRSRLDMDKSYNQNWTRAAGLTMTRDAIPVESTIPRPNPSNRSGGIHGAEAHYFFFFGMLTEAAKTLKGDERLLADAVLNQMSTGFGD